MTYNILFLMKTLEPPSHRPICLSPKILENLIPSLIAQEDNEILCAVQEEREIKDQPNRVPQNSWSGWYNNPFFKARIKRNCAISGDLKVAANEGSLALTFQSTLTTQWKYFLAHALKWEAISDDVLPLAVTKIDTNNKISTSTQMSSLMLSKLNILNK